MVGNQKLNSSVKLSHRAALLVKKLRLKPHPEGGFYRETFRSPDVVHVKRGRRSALTQIYFLLAKGQRSRWHQVLSDESWNYIEGAPLALFQMDSKFKKCEKVVLGPLRGKSVPLYMISAGEWQAAESLGDYTLVTCLVAPGFEFQDFFFLTEKQIQTSSIFSKNKKMKSFC